LLKKQFKIAKLLPDIVVNSGRKWRQKNLGWNERIKEETGLRCGGRGKSEISSAL
jgi:hypothetical protein